MDSTAQLESVAAIVRSPSASGAARLVAFLESPHERVQLAAAEAILMLAEEFD